ncbi:MAG TPA: VWA domain-containing protein [Thermoanaerobaculia bacterium]|nr:VWA domain-containing protein [Thermoanaerobaculia bacterium]
MKVYRRVVLACLLCGLVSGTSLMAQKAPQDKGTQPGTQQAAQEELFIDTVNVSVVNVDVYVTDKKGNRINDLKQGDFEIYEDNRPMAVTNFYAVKDGKAVATADAPETAPEGATPIAALDQVAVPEDQKLSLVVYIDNFNIRPFNRNRVMRELRVFLNNKLTKGDQVMLVSYDRSTHIRRPFTSDPDRISAGLMELEKVTGHAVHYDSDRKDALRNIEDAQSANEAMKYARSYAESLYNDLSFTINAIKDLVNSLAGMPGRKAILYVSDGVPMMAGQDIFYAVQNKFGQETGSLTEAFSYDASRRFTELTSQANANRVTFYPIDAAGLRVFGSISAENQGPGQGIMIDSIEISNLQSTLQMMAEKTGGMAVINSNSAMPMLERIAQDFNTYYSLGYSPPHFGDGRYHKVEVKVKGKKGLVVRHREGYRDKTAETRMSDGTLAALKFPFEENPLDIELEFGPATQRQDGYYLQEVNVRIPIGKLALVPRDKSQEARVRLFLAAMDGDGDTSEVQQQVVPISVPEVEVATAVGKHYVYSVSLLMRPGQHKVGIGVRDDMSGQSSFLSRVVVVGQRKG